MKTFEEFMINPSNGTRFSKNFDKYGILFYECYLLGITDLSTFAMDGDDDTFNKILRNDLLSRLKNDEFPLN